MFHHHSRPCPSHLSPSCTLQVEAVCAGARGYETEVVICTYDCLRGNVGVLSTVPWKAAIFDEVGGKK